jgi:hypothetical protein
MVDLSSVSGPVCKAAVSFELRTEKLKITTDFI